MALSKPSKPPPYTEVASGGSPPPAAFLRDAPPQSVPSIGWRELDSYHVGTVSLKKPFISVNEVKRHLSLLHAFYELKQKVLNVTSKVSKTLWAQLDAERRWVYFVGLAIERFERWVRGMRPVGFDMFVEEFLPPLDVIMVWHTYLLNPGWYAEDVFRAPLLEPIGSFTPIFELDSCDLAERVTNASHPHREQNWTNAANCPFDPFEAASGSWLKDRDIACPQCGRIIAVPLISGANAGYLQNLRQPCVTCGTGWAITKDGLAAVKFVNDILPQEMVNDVWKDEPHFAGALFLPTDFINTTRGERVRTEIVKAFVGGNRVSPGKTRLEDRKKIRNRILYANNYSMKEIIRNVEKALGGSQVRIARRIAHAYTDDKPFSVDLVGAVLRHGRFIEKMHSLGWTAPGFFDSPEQEIIIKYGIVRYMSFMDLMTMEIKLVPTLDIDLVWHTHQLNAKRYESATMECMNRYIDHDDRVEASTLARSFDETSRLWQKKHGIPYTYCGCPLPDRTLGDKFSRLMRPRKPNPALQPPAISGVSDGTHPSDHDVVSGRSQGGVVGKGKKRLKETTAEMKHPPPFFYPTPTYVNNWGYDASSGENGHRIVEEEERDQEGEDDSGNDDGADDGDGDGG